MVSPHVGHPSRCNWYSVTWALISGSSNTWCRNGSGSSPESLSPQRRHSVGFSCWTSSQSSVGISGRSCFAWPGWPPRFRFDLRFPEAGFACGCCVLGGSDEFCGVTPNLVSSSRNRSKSMTTNARTAGVISASSSGGMACGMGLVDDIMHVIPKNAACVQINFSKIGPRGVNGYLRNRHPITA